MARHSAICRAIPRNLRSATGAEPARCVGCVKAERFSHFQEGSHTQANFQMRSMGIYGFFRKSASVSTKSCHRRQRNASIDTASAKSRRLDLREFLCKGIHSVPSLWLGFFGLYISS